MTLLPVSSIFWSLAHCSSWATLYLREFPNGIWRTSFSYFAIKAIIVKVELDLICMPRDQWHMSFLSKRLFKLPAQRK